MPANLVRPILFQALLLWTSVALVLWPGETSQAQSNLPV